MKPVRASCPNNWPDLALKIVHQNKITILTASGPSRSSSGCLSDRLRADEGGLVLEFTSSAMHESKVKARRVGGAAVALTLATVGVGWASASVAPAAAAPAPCISQDIVVNSGQG